MLYANLRDLHRQGDEELAENIRQVKAMGLNVDDDNEALPENVPGPDYLQKVSKPDDLALQELGQSWGCSGIDEREKLGVEKEKAKLRHNLDKVAFEHIFYLQMFLLFSH